MSKPITFTAWGTAPAVVKMRRTESRAVAQEFFERHKVPPESVDWSGGNCKRAVDGISEHGLIVMAGDERVTCSEGEMILMHAVSDAEWKAGGGYEH